MKKAQARSNRDSDIEECKATLAELAEACGPPLPGAKLRDRYGKPARVGYDEAMRRILRTDRAAFAIVTAARASGHPCGDLVHLRGVLGVLLKNPISNAPGAPSMFRASQGVGRTEGYAIDASDLGLADLAPEIAAAHVELLAIEQRRAAERDIGAPGVDPIDELTSDPTCVEIAEALASGPKTAKAMRTSGAHQVTGSERTIGNRLKRMREAKLVQQAKPRLPYALTSKGRDAFKLSAGR